MGMMEPKQMHQSTSAILLTLLLFIHSVSNAESAAAQERSDCERLGRNAVQGAGAGYGYVALTGSYFGTVFGLTALTDDEDLDDEKIPEGIGIGLGTMTGVALLSLLGSSHPEEPYGASQECRMQYDQGYAKETRWRRLKGTIIGGMVGTLLGAVTVALLDETESSP
jgi:hypothetical protein